MVMKWIFTVIALFFCVFFIFIFLSPSQYFPTSNLIKEKLFVSSFVSNVPDKKKPVIIFMIQEMSTYILIYQYTTAIQVLTLKR